MDSLLFTIGRIRALEGHMLQPDHLERMVASATPADAFRVLADTEYAQFLDADTDPKAFQSVLDAGLLDAKNLITNEGGQFPQLFVLWAAYDVANIKAAFRTKLSGGSVDDFVASGDFSSLGSLTLDDVTTAVWDAEAAKKLPVFGELIANVHEAESFTDVEQMLDRCLYYLMGCEVDKAPTTFLRQYVSHMVDSSNLRTSLRSLLTRDEDYDRSLYVTGGSLDFDTLNQGDLGAWLDAVKNTNYAYALTDIEPDTHVAEVIQTVETRLEAQLQNWLLEQEAGEITTVQIPLAYFKRRAHNARLIQYIMMAKFAGINNETIKERINHLS